MLSKKKQLTLKKDNNSIYIHQQYNYKIGLNLDRIITYKDYIDEVNNFKKILTAESSKNEPGLKTQKGQEVSSEPKRGGELQLQPQTIEVDEKNIMAEGIVDKVIFKKVYIEYNVGNDSNKQLILRLYLRGTIYINNIFEILSKYNIFKNTSFEVINQQLSHYSNTIFTTNMNHYYDTVKTMDDKMLFNLYYSLNDIISFTKNILFFLLDNIIKNNETLRDNFSFSFQFNYNFLDNLQIFIQNNIMLELIDTINKNQLALKLQRLLVTMDELSSILIKITNNIYKNNFEFGTYDYKIYEKINNAPKNKYDSDPIAFKKSKIEDIFKYETIFTELFLYKRIIVFNYLVYDKYKLVLIDLYNKMNEDYNLFKNNGTVIDKNLQNYLRNFDSEIVNPFITKLNDITRKIYDEKNPKSGNNTIIYGFYIYLVSLLPTILGLFKKYYDWIYNDITLTIDKNEKKIIFIAIKDVTFLESIIKLYQLPIFFRENNAGMEKYFALKFDFFVMLVNEISKKLNFIRRQYSISRKPVSSLEPFLFEAQSAKNASFIQRYQDELINDKEFLHDWAILPLREDEKQISTIPSGVEKEKGEEEEEEEEKFIPSTIEESLNLEQLIKKYRTIINKSIEEMSEYIGSNNIKKNYPDLSPKELFDNFTTRINNIKNLLQHPNIVYNISGYISAIEIYIKLLLQIIKDEEEKSYHPTAENAIQSLDTLVDILSIIRNIKTKNVSRQSKMEIAIIIYGILKRIQKNVFEVGDSTINKYISDEESNKIATYLKENFHKEPEGKILIMNQIKKFAFGQKKEEG
jgi:hypothetical protein